MKKIIALISAITLAAGICVSGASVHVSAETWYDTKYSVDDVKETYIKEVKYSYVIDNGSVIILGLSSRSDVVAIPDTIDDYPVTGIGVKGFGGGRMVAENSYNIYGVRQIKKLIIPEGVTYLGYSAFAELPNLTEVTLPDTLEFIDDECFAYCPKLKSIEIPDSVKSIGDYAFAKCTSLKEAKLPAGITELKNTFHECSSLKSITIPESVTSIDGAFSFCTDLEEVIWNSDNITDITGGSFLNTKWFINYPEEYILIDNGKYLYAYTGHSEEFTIPDGVERVQGWAFGQEGVSTEGIKDTLKKITVPANFKEVTGGMFAGMSKLEEVVFEGDIYKIGPDAFSCCGFSEFTVPDGVRYINSEAFSDCENLKTIKLPEGLEFIGDRCFSYCKSLENITLPESLTGIGTRVFEFCDSLKKLNVPEGIADKLDKYTFRACKVEKAIFKGDMTDQVYYSLPKIAWDGVNTDENGFIILDDVIVSYVGNDKHVDIPEGVKGIGKKVFTNLEVETVSFPSTLERIDMYAFYSSNLKEVTIPSTVKSVGMMAFAECANLTKVKIEGGTKLGELAFAYCEDLDDVTMGENVKVSYDSFDDTLYQKRTNPKEGDEIPTAKPKQTSAPVSTPAPVPSPAATAVPTEQPAQKHSFTVSSGSDSLNVTIDAVPVTFTDAKPFIDENSRTLLPVRAVMESMKCKVDYDNSERMVKISGEGIDISLKIGESVMNAGGKNINMDTAAQIVDDRTYIPARFVAEALGYEVEWKN